MDVQDEAILEVEQARGLFDELARELLVSLRGVVRGPCAPFRARSSAADDVVGDTILLVLESLPRLVARGDEEGKRWTRSTLRRFIFGMARKAAWFRSLHDAKGERRFVPDEADAADTRWADCRWVPDTLLQAREDEEEREELLEQIAPEELKVLLASASRTYGDLAGELGCSPRTVRNRAWQIRKRLRLGRAA